MKTIKTLVIALASFAIITSCSTEWEEAALDNTEICYSKYELPCTIAVGHDQATINFGESKSGSIFINDIHLDDFKDVWEYKIYDLKPNEPYKIHVQSFSNNVMHSKTFDITTLPTYISQIGWHLLDPHNYGETELESLYPYPDGDIIDGAYTTVRRFDADGNLKWRTSLDDTGTIKVADDGGIAVDCHKYACRINPETGDILYKCSPTDKKVVINDVYPCSNGGMVIVGYKWFVSDEVNVPSEGRYYFGLFDAHGNVVNEEIDTLATDLLKVIETTDGNYIAMGQKGGQTIALITFSANGKAINSDTDYLECRDLDYIYNIQDAKKDKEGNVYFLATEEIGVAPSYYRALVVKVNAKGDIVWTRPLIGTECYESSGNLLQILDDNNICVVYTEGLYRSCNTIVVLITADNELVQGTNLGVNVSPINIFPLNKECTEFKIYNSNGGILYIDFKGKDNDWAFTLKDGL